MKGTGGWIIEERAIREILYIVYRPRMGSPQVHAFTLLHTVEILRTGAQVGRFARPMPHCPLWKWSWGAAQWKRLVTAKFGKILLARGFVWLGIGLHETSNTRDSGNGQASVSRFGSVVISMRTVIERRYTRMSLLADQAVPTRRGSFTLPLWRVHGSPSGA